MYTMNEMDCELTNEDLRTLRKLPAIPRNKFKIYQGDVVFIVAKTRERTGWYQKLRCENGKVNYVKINPPCESRTVYSQQTVERFDWSNVNDGYPYITYIVSGGEKVAMLMANDFDVLSDVAKEKLAKLLDEQDQLQRQLDSVKRKINGLKAEMK